jgi:uncharacterized protein RhaS with RHS repeats
VTASAYDRFSNLTSVTDPLGQTESYTYDINGANMSLSKYPRKV